MADRLEVGRQDDDGKLTRCSDMVIQKGDFVDVTITAEIRVSKGGDKRRVEVFYMLERIIQLKPRSYDMVRTLCLVM